MFNLSLQQKGWMQAFVAVLVFYGFNNIMSRYSGSVLDVNPIIYSCVAFCSCALILILNGGRGSLAKETMRSVDTWSYGIILMFCYITEILLFSYISATQGTLLQKVGVLMAISFSWLFFARRPDKFQSLGTLIITAGVIIVALDVNSENKGLIFLLTFLYASFQLARVVTAELHRPHAKAAQSKNDPKAKSRVIGFVMFVVSTMFLALTFIIACAQELQESPIESLPTFADFMHSPTIFAGFIAGIFIAAPLRLLEFSSTHIIKAENFTTVTALSFIATVFWENISAPFTGIDVTDISSLDLFAGTLITIGGLLIALTRKLVKKDTSEQYIHVETQNIENIDDTRNIIASSLEHFKHDVKKVSLSLDIPEHIIKKIMSDSNKTLAFNERMLKKAARNYRINIASADSLTGLLNRSGFLTGLQAASNESDDLSLFYLDLNKFKPVNDTYGHAAGDFVLKEIGDRLRALFPEKSLMTRLGGDEFCILLLDKTKDDALKLIDTIINEVEKPVTIDGNNISVSTAVGIANYPTDTNDSGLLLEIADKNMFNDKSER
jgi:diguanylate cyclase (GGDEF)-like protein